MTADRWTEVKDALAQADEMGREERAAFLGTLPDEIRDEVNDLLGASTTTGLLDAPIGSEVRAESEKRRPPSDEEDPIVGSRIGPYLVTGVLGRGGMGDVYRARRDDGLFDREVALKLVRAEANSTVLLNRFAAERRALATLQHPGIARMLGAGTTDEGPAAGRPWIAMEVVEGEELIDFVRTHALSRRDRVELMADIADAVHHAHQSLIVHRDLKPSNVLVSMHEGRPRPVLLDFGVAKIVDPEADLELTAVDGARPVTRSYAAPEQIRGDTATTATDIYALGLLTYHVLSGRRPFSHVTGPMALEQAVLNEDAPAPSTKADAERGGLEAAELSGDLDAICHVALRRDPAERYASAFALAADLRRHLAGLPVEARPPTLRYRSSRFLRRNRLAVTASAAFILTLAVAGALHTQRLAAERDRAQTAAAQAEELAEVMAQMFDRDPFAADAERLDSVSVGEFVLNRGDAAVARLSAQPAVQMRLLSLLSRLHGQLGDSETALTRARRAVALADSLGKEGSDVARAYTELATILEIRGEYSEAEMHFRRAWALSARVSGSDGLDAASAMSDLSNVLILSDDTAKKQEAIALARRALDIHRELLEPTDLLVAKAHNSLGGHLIDVGQPTEAEPHLRRALEIRKSALGEHPLVANTTNNLANLVEDLGDLERSAALFQEATRVYRATLGPTHPAASASQYGLSRVLRDLGRYRAAEAAGRDALRLDRAALPPDHPFIADELALLGGILQLDGRCREAEPLVREAIRIYGAEAGDEGLAEPRSTLGICRLETGARDEARALLTPSVPHLKGRAAERAKAALRRAGG